MLKKILLASAMGVSVALGGLHVDTATAKSAYPVETWAAPAFMSNVSLSPDGKYVAFVKAESRKGDNIIEVYETANMSKEPRRVGAKSMDLRGFSWIGDSEMLVNFDKQVSKRIKGFNRGAFRGKLALYDMETNKFRELTDDTTSFQLLNVLPDDPEKVLVRIFEFKEGKSFGAPADYIYDLKSGGKKLVLKGGGGLQGVRYDHEGNPRFAVRFDDGSEEAVFVYRPVGGSGWTEYARQSRDSFETFRYAGLVEGNPDQIYVIANNGQDRAALWKYNLSSKSFGEKVFSHPEVNVAGTTRHSNSWENPGLVTGVVYGTDKYHRQMFDREEEAIISQFENALPNAHQVQVTTRSRDGNTLVLFNSGPKDPGSYYLFAGGKLSRLGSVNGLLNASQLADVEYISYTARDGRKIPAFLTKPKGAGPHPTIVMPHGGPFVPEVVGWDNWAQMLANNGYAVLQPQYRGSTNFGLEHYKAGFAQGGEGGKKMQDDKDDGLKHLIDRGIADPNKAAMFGWSYGGYAAFIAAARPDNMYKCTIAGAGVADNMQQVNYYRNRLRGAQKVEQMKFWTESVNPIDIVDDVNVPMLVIHGSIDQRVPIKHSDKYVKALKSAGKAHEYVVLKDADHFLNTLDYDHYVKMFPAMLNFLADECGMPTAQNPG